MNPQRVRLVMTVLLILCVSTAFAQQGGKKEHTFRGKVEQVDAKSKMLTVNGEKVDGWMGAMTMSYPVKDEQVLTAVAPGDQITAKVITNGAEYWLEGVTVVGKK